MTETVRLPDVHVPEEFAEAVRADATERGETFADYQRQALGDRAGLGPVKFNRDAGGRLHFARSYGGVENPYSFSGQGPSFVRDAWVHRNPMETTEDAYAARRRLEAFTKFQEHAAAQFATVTRTVGAALVEPEYEPLVATFEADRPLYAASSKANIRGPVPFALPANLAEAGVAAAVAVTAEGVNRADGTFPVITGRTVTPIGVQGLFRVTRELMDSANPALDVLALSVLRESYARQTEALVYAELNGANGQDGTITAGFVPSGSMARTSTGTALPADLRKAIAAYVNGRGQRPRAVVASSRPAVAEALETLDGSTVPLGSEAMWQVNACSVSLSPAITGTAAGDADAFILGAGDLWCWASPIMEFTYHERQGPGLIDLALFGYFATALANPRGLSAIRHT